MAESHDLTRFELPDMVVLGRSLRRLARGCESVEELAVRLTDHLYDAFAEPASGAGQTVLVRCYLTVDHRSAAVLTGSPIAAVTPSGQPAPSRYLALLASRGRLPEWNDRRRSAGHQAIALSSAALAVSPMISALLEQLGVDLGALSATGESVITDPDDVHFGVFHVQEAAGSAHIPAQDFVSDHGVRSALGFGGLLPDGSVFAVVMFTGVNVPAATATLFRTVSLSVRLALLELDGIPLVAVGRPSDPARGEPLAAPRRKPQRMRKLRAERAMLEQLVRVHENTTLAEATRAAEALKRWQGEAERASTLARTFQESLLPAALPELAGVSVAGIFRPAGDGSEIGGDFYDVFTAGDSSAWFVVGDVSGKGAGAAALTSVARSTLRAVSSGSLATPLSCLRSLNEAVLAHDADRHLTAVVGRLRTGRSGLRVTLALAGHPPALLLPAQGPLRPVGVPGTALGLFEQIDVTEVRTDLGPGDILLAFTDGVTEARNRDRDFFGDDRLADLVQRLRGCRPAELTQVVAQAVLDYQSDWAADDIALLAIGPAPD